MGDGPINSSYTEPGHSRHSPPPPHPPGQPRVTRFLLYASPSLATPTSCTLIQSLITSSITNTTSPAQRHLLHPHPITDHFLHHHQPRPPPAPHPITDHFLYHHHHQPRLPPAPHPITGHLFFIISISPAHLLLLLHSQVISSI